jgi:prolyl 4-hydroxylase
MSHGDLKHYVRVYDEALDAALCRQMIDSFTNLGRFQARNGRGVRAGLEESAWTELNVTRLSDEAFTQMFRRKIDAALERYNRDVGLQIPLPNSRTLDKLVMKRYRPLSEERFQLHWDSIHHVANRYLVLLWYLNDVAEGGETHFPQLDISVAPRVGRLLMFPPYWMYQHEGVTPRSGDKYILSTYLLFTPEAPKPVQAS